MTSTYNKDEHARLVQLQADVKAKREAAAETVRDLVAGTDGWDGTKDAAHNQAERAIATYDRELDDIKVAIAGMVEAKPKTDEEIKAIQSQPLNRWMRKGLAELTPDERVQQQNLLDSFGSDAATPSPKFVMPFDTSALDGKSRQPKFDSHGNLVRQSPKNAITDPDALSNTIVIGIDQDYYDELDDFGGALDVFTTIHTSHGNKMEFLIDKDTADGLNVSLSANLPKSDLKTAQVEQAMSGMDKVDLEVQLYNSGYVDISKFLFEDVAFNPDRWVRRTIMRRMGRRLEYQAANGTGAANNPRGFIPSSVEYTTTEGTAGKMVYQDTILMEHAIDRAYLRGMEAGLYGYDHIPGITCYLTSWPYAAQFKLLRDLEGRPIYLPGFQSHELMSINGYPVKICQEFADTTMAANKKPYVFGNFRYMTSRYAGAGFMIEQFYDSGTASTNSLRYLGKVRWGCGIVGPQPTAGKCPSLRLAKIKA